MTVSFLRLCQAQSCGKCVPCRTGIAQMINLMTDILNLNVKSRMKDMELLERTAEGIMYSSDCAIGS